MPTFINNLLSRVGIAKKSEKETKKAATPTVAKSDAFLQIVSVIDAMVEEGVTRLRKVEDRYAVIYLLGDKKILHIPKNVDPPRTFFLYSGANRVAKGMDVPGLRVVSKNEAKQKKYGPIKAVYTGINTEVVKDMLKLMDSYKTA